MSLIKRIRGMSWAKKLVAAGTIAAAYFCLRRPPLEDVEKRFIAEQKFDTHALVVHKNGHEYPFTRFRNNFAPFSPPELSRYMITLRDDDWIHHKFWLNKVNRIEMGKEQEASKYLGNRLLRWKGERDAAVYLNDGRKFVGVWTSPDSPNDFYYTRKEKSEDCLCGMLKEWLSEAPKMIYGNDVVRLDLDTSGSRKALEDHISKHTTPSYPKKIELHDGTVFEGYHGYILDCLGAWGDESYDKQLEMHITLEERRFPQSSGPWLAELSEIMLTGKFHEKHGQCREVVLTYKDGRKETDYIRLISESIDGVSLKSEKYREWDKFVLFNDYGAVMVPLGNVRRIIIPHSESYKIPGGGEK